jgi:hypothetical protein
MSGTFLSVPVFRAVDANGAPIAGALLQFYLTGTTSPANIYTSASLATGLSNPVVADAGGLFVPIYLDPTVTYRVQLQTAGGAVIRDIDPVAAPLSIPGGSVTALALASGAAVTNIGYVPLNKGGDTATNLLLANTALSSNSAGYIGAPLNEQDAAYTFALSDAGKLVRGVPTAAVAWTIPPQSSVAWTAGTVILLRNASLSASVITITRGPGVILYAAGSATNKDWALAANGLATLIYEFGNNSWVVTGTGLS